MKKLNELLIQVEQIIQDSSNELYSVDYSVLERRIKVQVSNRFYNDKLSKHDFKTKSCGKHTEKSIIHGGILYFTLILNLGE